MVKKDKNHSKNTELNKKQKRRQYDEIIRHFLSQESGVLLLDSSGRILHANDQFLNASEYTCDDFEQNNINILRILPENSHSIFNKVKEEIKLYGAADSFKTFFITKTGKKNHAVISLYKPISEEVFFAVYFRDIKERADEQEPNRADEYKKIKEALLESEERFQKAFNVTPAALMITDIEDGRIVEVNNALIKLSGYKAEELIGNTTLNLNMYYTKEDRDKAISILKSKGSVRELEINLKFRNDKKRTVLLSMEYLKMSGGRLILTVLQDITQRRLNEQKITESESKLKEAQRLARLGYYVIDLKTREVDLSDEMAELIGYFREEKLLLEEGFNFVHPDDLEYVKVKIEELIAFKRPYEYEARILSGDKVKYVHSYGKPVLGADGEVEKIFGTVAEITELKQAQLKLEAALIEVQRSNKDLEQFAYIASHDLQEPIRMIRSYAQLLLLKFIGMADEAREYLSYIDEGAARMQQLTEDLLQYSRVTIRKQEFIKIDCRIIVKDVIKDFKFRIEEEKARIIVGGLPVIMGDKTQIRQLFQNFIHNALKFRGNAPPVIEINCEQKNKLWLFSVKDNGIGIEPKYFGRLFVIFQRLHNREKYPGTGIGLALCKKIVERHGGEICVESEPGKGSTFYFTIPVS